MNKLQYGIKFVSLKPSGAPLTSGAPGLCPPTTYGCYATAPHTYICPSLNFLAEPPIFIQMKYPVYLHLAMPQLGAYWSLEVWTLAMRILHQTLTRCHQHR